MCSVSFVGDAYRDQWPKSYPTWPTAPAQLPMFIPTISREEFDALKAEMQELKKALQAAKAHDEATGQPDCEMAQKVEFLRAVAKAVGVDLSDVFKE